MDLTASFFQTVSLQMQGEGLTPSVLARAVTDLLPVDAGGISTLLGALRLPLGASSDAAQTAEVLQTSLGEGPCLAAAVAKSTCVADLAELTTRWPVYGDELTRQTPFRSVAAVPLRTPDGAVYAALDLFAEDDHLSQRLDLDAVTQHIAAPVSALLGLCMADVRDLDLEQDMPEWYRVATARRHRDAHRAQPPVHARRAQRAAGARLHARPDPGRPRRRPRRGAYEPRRPRPLRPGVSGPAPPG
jgi:hypothetical protein